MPDDHESSLPYVHAPEAANHDESEKKFKQKLTSYFRQMMFVSGETAEPSPETTGMIEELVKQQVMEMVSFYS